MSDPTTNGQAIRQGFVPCETNPKTGGLSRTGDTFHGPAAFTVGHRVDVLRHVCAGCAREHHPSMKIRKGVLWARGVRRTADQELVS